MKPAVFIGSSLEHLDLAHAIQEALEPRNVEPTVWTQGLFEPSKYVMESLLDVLAAADFGVFVFAPDDVVKIRDVELAAVRDNIVFEIGLFIGRLGRERVFLVVPRGELDLRFPSDLAGVTPAEYEPNRQDGNLVAAVGPACSRIARAIARFGKLEKTAETVPTPIPAAYDEQDLIGILTSWMGSRPSGENTRIINFRETDTKLKLPAGTTEKYIERVAARWGYRPQTKGAQTILLENSRF